MSLSECTTVTQRFFEVHPICDMLGLNLTHPRFAIDHIDLGRKDSTICRGDFVKFAEWGMRVIMCKGGGGRLRWQLRRVVAAATRTACRTGQPGAPVPLIGL